MLSGNRGNRESDESKELWTEPALILRRARAASSAPVAGRADVHLDPVGGDPSAPEVLSLVACHPFCRVGPARNRLIVRAERFAP